MAALAAVQHPTNTWIMLVDAVGCWLYLDKLTLKERFCLPLATPRPMLDHHMLGSYQNIEPITWFMDAVTLCALPEITSVPRARCDCQRMAQRP